MPEDPNKPGTDTDPNGKGNDTDPNATGDDKDKSQAAKKSISFDPDQREWIETHGDEMFGKGYSRAEKIYKQTVADTQKALDEAMKQLETLKASKSESVKGDEGNKGGDQKPNKQEPVQESEELKRMRAQLEELQGGIKALQTEKKEAVEKLSNFETERTQMRLRTEFMNAIPQGTQFFDNDEVFSIIQRDLDVVDGKVVIKNHKTGMPRLNRDMTEPMTLSEFLAEFAERKPHHVKASEAGGGTGASDQRRVNTQQEKVDIDSMTPQQFETFLSNVKAGKI